MIKLAVLRATVVGLALAMAVPWAALADQQEVDNDVALSGNQNVVTVDAAAGMAVILTAQLTIQRSGNNHVPGSTTVTFSYHSQNSSNVPAGATVGSAQITTPRDWPCEPKKGQAGGFEPAGCTAAYSGPDVLTAVAAVSFTMPSVNADTIATIKWIATGAFDANELTGTPALVVTLKANVPTDTTPPVVTGTGKNADLSAYTAGTWTNQDVTITFTCTDAETTCAPASEELTATETDTYTSQPFTDEAGNSATGSFSVKIDKTPPTIGITVSGTTGNNGWYTSDVTVTFTCGDQGGSGLAASCPAAQTLSQSGSSTAQTIFDNAGNSALSETVTVQIDKTKPTITAAAATAPNANDWYKADVTVTFTCADGGSGLADACPADQTLSTEGSAVSSTAETISDNAGNSETSNVVTLKIDKTAPLITGSASGTTGNNGWYTSDVTIDFVCVDALSGIASCTEDVILSTDGELGSTTGTATDKAGNEDSVTVPSVKIDKTKPSVTVSGSGGTYALGSGPTATCADATSGVAGAATWTTTTQPQDANGFGVWTGTFTCADNAGNTQTSDEISYTVTLAQSISCFISPIKADQTYSAKAGSTIPMKCLLTAALAAPEQVGLTVVVTKPDGNVLTTVIDSGKSNGNGTTMRYSASMPGYVFNWQTTDSQTRTAKPLALGEYKFTVTAGGIAQPFEARITLTK